MSFYSSVGNPLEINPRPAYVLIDHEKAKDVSIGDEILFAGGENAGFQKVGTVQQQITYKEILSSPDDHVDAYKYALFPRVHGLCFPPWYGCPARYGK